MRGPVIRIFFLEIIFSFFSTIWKQILLFFYLNAPIFYNFPNVIYFEFLKFYLINKLCEFLNLVNLRKNFNRENLIFFGIVKILEVC